MPGEITYLTVTTSDQSNLTVQSGEVTLLNTVPATINLANASYATTAPEDIARESSIGVLNIAARADHVHSIANTLLDGGNY